MVLLGIQLAVFGILVALRQFGAVWPFLTRAGAIAIGVMLVVTGVFHFIKVQPMVAMFPPSVPYREFLVYASGVFEIAAGVCLILGIGPMAVIGYALMAFFALALPLNVYSAINGTGLGAKGIDYLWFRVPLQFFWVWWVYRFVVRG